MHRLRLTFSLLLAASLLGSAHLLQAQDHTGRPALFAKSRLGFTQYTGENSPSVLSAPCSSPACSTGAYGVAMEIGLQWSPALGASVAYQTASYPAVAAFSAVPAYYARNYRVRETVQFLTHYRFAELVPRLTPYLQSGMHVTMGRTPLPNAMRAPNGQMRVVERWAFGPSFGAGLDVAVNRHLAVFAEVATNVAVPDDALDGQGGFLGADRLSWAGVGLRFNSTALSGRLMTSQRRGSSIPMATAPLALTVGEIGRFELDVDADELRSGRFEWTFSDGSTQEGAAVTKQFATPGTYRAVVRARGSDEPLHTFQVRVRRAPPPLRVDAIHTSTDTLRTDTAVSFEPVLGSGTPVEYRWSFGDGTTAFTRAPTYTYQSPGAYEVTLQVISTAGQVTHRRTVMVHDADATLGVTAPYLVQLGAFSNAERAKRFARRHVTRLPKPPQVAYDAETGYYRVGLAYTDRAAATGTLRQLRRSAAFADAFMHRSAADPPAPSVADRRDPR